MVSCDCNNGHTPECRERRAFDGGFNCKFMGKGLHDNPYFFGSQLFFIWVKGWTYADHLSKEPEDELS